MPVNIEIKNLQTAVPLNLPNLKATIRKVLKKEKVADADLSFAFVSDRKIRALNKKYLRHDRPTDVLSFSLGDKGLKGEVIISAQTAGRQAKVFGTSLKEEVLLYMVHGILHLLGYDDHTPAQIKRMREKEQEMLTLI